MNNSYNLNRMPLNEVVRKHGSSKLFLSAIVITFVYVTLNLLYSIFSTVASFNTSIPFVDLGGYFDEEIYIVLFATFLIAVVNSILSFVQCGYLYSAYSFFSGRAGNKDALKSFTKVFLAQMIVTIVEMPVVLLGTVSSMDDSYAIPGILEAFTIIMGVILIPIIAGVIVAFCIPATLKKGTGYYLERIRRHVNNFPEIEIDEQHNTIVLTNEQVHTLKSIESAADKMISPLQDLEDNLHFPISYIVIPLFAFANAGIDLAGMSFGALFSGVSLAVMLGLVLGKFIGVFSFSWLAVRLKLVSLPAGTTWKAFASVCVICGIGFTVSMFIADLSYAGIEGGEALLGQAKLGVLTGSVLAAVLGCLLLNKTLPKEC